MGNEDKQGITAGASPRPWCVETNRFGQHYVVCESGSGDRVRDYIAGPIQNESDAALIVEAVNALDAVHALSIKLYGPLRKAEDERDRLRDIVRRLLTAIDALYTVAAPRTLVKELAPNRTCLGVPIGAIVAGARSALGEGE